MIVMKCDGISVREPNLWVVARIGTPAGLRGATLLVAVSVTAKITDELVLVATQGCARCDLDLACVNRELEGRHHEPADGIGFPSLGRECRFQEEPRIERLAHPTFDQPSR
jgi:hypothetical protein